MRKRNKQFWWIMPYMYEYWRSGSISSCHICGVDTTKLWYDRGWLWRYEPLGWAGTACDACAEKRRGE